MQQSPRIRADFKINESKILYSRLFATFAGNSVAEYRSAAVIGEGVTTTEQNVCATFVKLVFQAASVLLFAIARATRVSKVPS